MRDFDRLPCKGSHPYAWLWEPLEGEASLILRAMFGAKALYLDGRLRLLFFAKRDPWRGVLVCTDRERQPFLVADFPSLEVHPILAKWLYLPETAEDFDSAAQRLVALVQRRDGRIGVEGSTRQKVGGRRKAPAKQIAKRRQ